MRIAGLYRYPVKGLSPEPMARVALEAGAYVPGDRLYAVENGPSGFDPRNPVHRSKRHYLMLMRHEALARLETRYDHDTHVLTIRDGGAEAARGDLSTGEGRAAIEAFFLAYMGDALDGMPKVLAAPEGFRFTDSPTGYVSLVNRASLAELEGRVGTPVDPLRFRANLVVEGLPAFAELDLVDHVLAGPSGLRLRVRERTVRCAATNVDPTTGIRDLAIPKTLMQAYGHADCGVYAEIVAGGSLAVGERLTLEPARAAASASLPF
ncbi:MOSC domain-containing protein [Salinarimonas ramus]|uniref:Molybdenum cofactor sulfurase n=1 Tax=Salinarimonas ramus TaxID=690164 RepID=A0A917Q8R0_9HYPH|nr:MOSC domain-containing protein [Salinarimonas ramus]GGK35359.1 molybdenum cofactor sulfurase [Salinarimonas ramus]